MRLQFSIFHQKNCQRRKERQESSYDKIQDTKTTTIIT